MLRRVSLVVLLIAALGAGVAIADSVAQKNKAKKDADEVKEQEKQKEKQKTLFESSPGWFALEMTGDGGYLGVYLEEVTPERAKELGLKEERGAIVMKVMSDSPAEKSGLKENDVVVSFNGRRVDSVREMQRLLSETPADRTVQIEVVRGGSRQTMSATLAKRSFSNSKLFDDGVLKSNEEAMRRYEEAFKRSEEDWKRSQERFQERFKTLPRDFGDFAFVSPGEFGLFSGTRLGISAESLTDQLAEYFGVKDGKGVLVSAVSENSAAAKAGIKAGDVIIAIGDQRVDSVRTLLKSLSGKEGTVSVKIIRNHAEQTINVSIEKREPLTPRRRALARFRSSAAA